MQAQATAEAAQAALQTASVLLPQFPWQALEGLEREALHARVLPALTALLDALSAQAAEGMSNGDEVAAVLFKVRAALCTRESTCGEACCAMF